MHLFTSVVLEFPAFQCQNTVTFFESVFLLLYRSAKAKNMMKHLIVPEECQLQQGLDPVTLLHKLDTIFGGRRNGFSKPSSVFGGQTLSHFISIWKSKTS